MWALWSVVVASVVIAPSLALACSGPGAMQRIERAERLGALTFFATVVGALALALLPRLRSLAYKPRWILGALVVVHPGWWLSARGGDCGATRVEGSLLVTAIAFVVGVVFFVRAGRASRAQARDTHET